MTHPHRKEECAEKRQKDTLKSLRLPIGVKRDKKRVTLPLATLLCKLCSSHWTNRRTRREKLVIHLWTALHLYTSLLEGLFSLSLSFSLSFLASSSNYIARHSEWIHLQQIAMACEKKLTSVHSLTHSLMSSDFSFTAPLTDAGMRAQEHKNEPSDNKCILSLTLTVSEWKRERERERESEWE